VDVYIHIFLTSAIAGGEWSASHTGLFTPGERAPSTHWIGGWVHPRADLDDVEKILDPTRIQIPTPQSSSLSPDATSTMLSQLDMYVSEQNFINFVTYLAKYMIWTSAQEGQDMRP
jgi:hypothetical protein